MHAGMQANTAVSKCLQHHEERSGARVYLSSRIAEEVTEKIKKRTPSYLPYSKEVVAQKSTQMNPDATIFIYVQNIDFKEHQCPVGSFQFGEKVAPAELTL